MKMSIGGKEIMGDGSFKIGKGAENFSGYIGSFEKKKSLSLELKKGDPIKVYPNGIKSHAAIITSVGDLPDGSQTIYFKIV